LTGDLIAMTDHSQRIGRGKEKRPPVKKKTHKKLSWEGTQLGGKKSEPVQPPPVHSQIEGFREGGNSNRSGEKKKTPWKGGGRRLASIYGSAHRKKKKGYEGRGDRLERKKNMRLEARRRRSAERMILRLHTSVSGDGKYRKKGGILAKRKIS